MTKMIKMSLVAAVAVAGLTTTASAVDVSYKGKLYVENHAETVKDSETVTGYEIDFDVTGTAKINDNFSAVVGIEADTDQDDDSSASSASVSVDDAYIQYANDGFTLKFGRQAINTPTTDGENGEGVLATYTINSITLAAAHFGNNGLELNNVNIETDAHALAILGAFGPLNFELWSVGVANVNVNNTLVVGGNFKNVTLGARYAVTNYDASGIADGKTAMISASGKAGNIGLSAAYLTTSENGAAFTTDASSANTAELVKFTAANTGDVDAYILGIDAPFTSTLSGSIQYGSADIGDNADANEVVLTLTNKFASNLTGTLRYYDYSDSAVSNTNDETGLRADIKYTF